METLSIKKFREIHHCRLCLYYTKMKTCFDTLSCPLEETTTEHLNKRSCPLDEDGNCPYKNEVGTCFGFCVKRILQEQKERKQKDEQTEEQKENG